MDPFAVGVIVVVMAAVLAAIVCARAGAGRPLSDFGRRADSRLAASSNALERQDLEEMLAATNARRQVRGLPERSLGDAIREFGGE